MSLSKECQEYHLTHRGWVEGSFRGDFLGGIREAPIPADRVLTVGCYDELPSAYSEPSFTDQVLWQSDDDDAIQKLTDRYGRRPDWFGYKRCKR